MRRGLEGTFSATNPEEKQLRLHRPLFNPSTLENQLYCIINSVDVFLDKKPDTEV